MPMTKTLPKTDKKLYDGVTLDCSPVQEARLAPMRCDLDVFRNAAQELASVFADIITMSGQTHTLTHPHNSRDKEDETATCFFKSTQIMIHSVLYLITCCHLLKSVVSATISNLKK